MISAMDIHPCYFNAYQLTGNCANKKRNKRMDVNAAVTVIKESINEIFAQDGVGVEITEEMPLIGGDSDLDSMKLVELCLVLEDKASDIGFEFDWTSDTAMSKSRSMFRSIRSLAIEFVSQCEAQA